nr:glycosyltransferase family 4 protein [Microbacterium testaceum]
MLEGYLTAHTRGALQHVGYPFPLLPTLASAYLERGHRVSLVTTSRDVTAVVPYIDDRLSIVVAPSRPRARSRAMDMFSVERAGVASALRLVKPGIVHAHWTYEFALGALRANVAPTLITAHDAPLTVLKHMPDVYRLVRAAMAVRMSLKRPVMTAVSPYLAERWRQEMGFRGDMDVIPNPIPASSPFRSNPSEASSGPIVLSVADASRRKNVVTLISAFRLVREANPLAELRLVGDGLGPGDELALRHRAGDETAGVTFLGRLSREEVEREYASAQVFCHTSLEESQGLVLLEAARRGLPIVAGRNSGAVRWTLLDGEAGLLTDVRSPSDVALALISVLNDASNSIGRARDGERRLNERFGVDVVAGAYLRKYESVISGGPFQAPLAAADK